MQTWTPYIHCLRHKFNIYHFFLKKILLTFIEKACWILQLFDIWSTLCCFTIFNFLLQEQQNSGVGGGVTKLLPYYLCYSFKLLNLCTISKKQQCLQKIRSNRLNIFRPLGPYPIESIPLHFEWKGQFFHCVDLLHNVYPVLSCWRFWFEPSPR